MAAAQAAPFQTWAMANSLLLMPTDMQANALKQPAPTSSPLLDVEVVTTGHLVPFHVSARVPVEAPDRPPTATQLLVLTHETPLRLPVTAAASCRAEAAIAAEPDPAISSPAVSNAPAARVPPRPAG